MPFMLFAANNISPALRILPLLMLLAGSAQAYNAKAHQVAGYIAAAYACPATLAAVEALDTERGLAAAGLWADEIRRYEHMDFAKRWHYVNIPDHVSVKNFLRDKKRRHGRDVLFAVDYFRKLLADDSADRLDRIMAYRFLVHFVADVHQPLHVGRSDDQGGNRISVRVDGRRTSLHSYWDGYELRRLASDPREYAAYLRGLYADRDVATGGGLADWAQESKDYRPVVYAFGKGRWGKAPELDDEYREKSIEIINLRLYQAGRRLARMLDGIFCRDAVKR